MSHWLLTLECPDNTVIDEKRVYLKDIDNVPQLVHIEGNVEASSSWRFTQIWDDTQAKSEYISDIELKNGALYMKSEVDGVRIRQPPLDPRVRETSYFDLPFSLQSSQYIAVLRNGDKIDFTSHEVVMLAHFVYVPKEEEVEVKSSAVLQATPPFQSDYNEIPATENDAIVDTKTAADDDANGHQSRTRLGQVNGETQDDTQDPYSTSRERLSGSPTFTPRALRKQDAHQIVQETPSRLRLQQQASTISGVPDSLPPALPVGDSTLAFASMETSPDGRRKSEIMPAEVDETQSQLRQGHAVASSNDTALSKSDKLVEKRTTTLSKDSAMEAKSRKPSNFAQQTKRTRGSKAKLTEPEHIDSNPADETMVRVQRNVLSDGRPAQDGCQTGPSTDEDCETITVAPTRHLHHASPRNDQQQSDGVNPPSEPASVETPAPRQRGRKRKEINDDASDADTTSTKRVKRTEAQLLRLESGMPIESSPPGETRMQTQRRSSPRVVVSQKAESPTLDGPLRILFPSESKIPQRKGLMGFLRTHKVNPVVDSTPSSFDIFCVEKGELKRTAKLLSSLVNGKIIVTDEWIVESSKSKRLLTPGSFLPEGLEDTRVKDRSKVFKNMTIYFTPKLRSDYKKGWDDIRNIVEQAGANVLNCAPSKIPKGTGVDLYLASDENDSHACGLQEMGLKVYMKGILAQSIVMGEVQFDEEFELPVIGLSGSPASVASSKNGRSQVAAVSRRGRAKKK